MHTTSLQINSAAHKNTGALTFLVFAISFAGCDRTDEIAKQSRSADAPPARFVTADASAKQLIDQVARTYAGAASYRDRAYVRLLYTLDGQPVEDRAPLEIAFNRGSVAKQNSRQDAGLGLRVYSVSAGPSPDTDRWHFQSSSAQSNPPVIVSRKSPSRFTATWLLSDPWITESLSAGLVGFPLQLRLLLEPPQPEQGVAPAPRIAGTILQVLAAQGKLRAPVSVDGHLCETVVASVDGGTVAAWIDQDTKLLRRVRFPESALPGQMLGDSRIKDVQLTIEFEAAEINSPLSASYYGPKFDPQSLYLTEFVAPPVSIDTRLLGRRTPAFFLEDPSQRVVLKSSEKNRNGKILVLAWLANHPAAKVTAQQLRTLEQQLIEEAPELAAQVDFVSVWAEPSPPPGDSFASLPESWQLPGVLTVDRRAMGRDLFDVQEAPTVVVLDSQNRIQARIERGNPILEQLILDMLQRLDAGEDIAASTLLQASQSNSRYAMALHQNVAPDNVTQLPTRPREYLPLTLALHRERRTELNSSIVATASASDAGTWVLNDQGTLKLLTPGRSTRFQLRTNSKLSPRTRLCAGSDQIVALILPDGSGQILKFTSAHDPHVTEFDVGFTAEASRWVSIGNHNQDSLAILGSDRLAIIDPQSGKQLEAPLPTKALSLVGDSALLLSDGRLEPLQLPTGQPPITQSAQLPFAPAAGPWNTVSVRSATSNLRQLTLGTVWLGPEEPAAILLDANSKPIWHHRLPTATLSQASMGAGCALESECVFALAQPDGTIHVFRTLRPTMPTRDAPIQVVADHFRLPENLIAVDLLPHADGDRAVTLRAFHSSDFVEYRLSW